MDPECELVAVDFDDVPGDRRELDWSRQLGM
jgi:hypothetical protein